VCADAGPLPQREEPAGTGVSPKEQCVADPKRRFFPDLDPDPTFEENTDPDPVLESGQNIAI